MIIFYFFVRSFEISYELSFINHVITIICTYELYYFHVYTISIVLVNGKHINKFKM